jgi:hypothetical protein
LNMPVVSQARVRTPEGGGTSVGIAVTPSPPI